jgi:NADH-quinone oxidoreductase subunit N
MMLAYIILTVFSIGIMFLGFVRQRNLIIPVALIAVILSGYCILSKQPFWNHYLSDMVDTGGYSSVLSILLLSTGLGLIPFFQLFQKRGNEDLGDFLGIFLFALLGSILMVSAQNFMILFLGIEILSLSMYVLAGADRRKVKSNEASLKYFITGAFTSALFLFGIGLLYASRGSLSFVQVTGNPDVITNLAFVFIFVSFGLKIALVPFHFWAPDVYEGTPTLFTAAMATIVKVAAFGALFKIIHMHHDIMPAWMDWFFAILILVTLIYGNIMAMNQRSVKRLLAYSGIVQAGFILFGFIHLSGDSAWVIIYYLLAYTLSSLVSFIIVYFVEEQGGSDDIDSFAGLAFSNPGLAILMTFSMISLAGGPLTAGFIAKLFVLNNAVEYGFVSLVVVAVICTLMSVYYYYKIINAMFTKSADQKWSTPVLYTGLLTLFIIITLAAGILPTVFTEYFK